jgi:HlyD family secretion protein
MWRTLIGGLSLVLIAGALAIAGLGWSRPRPDLHEVPIAIAEKRPFQVVVTTVGELDAARAIVISSPVRGDRGKIIYLVDDGAAVEEGDVLVRLDPTPFEEEVERLRQAVSEAQSRAEAAAALVAFETAQVERELRRAHFEVDTAELDLKQLEHGDGPLELARLEGTAQKASQDCQETCGYVEDLRALEERGFITASEIRQATRKAEEARRAAEVAQRQLETYRDFVLPAALERGRARLAQAEHDLEHIRRTSAVKVSQAQAGVRSAAELVVSTRLAWERAQQELEATVIRAPIPGMVVLREEFRSGQRRKPRIGDSVFQNQPILYLPDVSRMLVHTRVREIDLHKVAAGHSVTIRIDAFPGLELRGEVMRIGVLAESEAGGRARGERSFSITIQVHDSDPRLRPGMTARAAILAMEVERALVLGIECIFEDHGRHYIYQQMPGGGFGRRRVVVGAHHEHLVQVIEGLEPGSRVARLRPPQSLVQSSSGQTP